MEGAREGLMGALKEEAFVVITSRWEEVQNKNDLS
jgi:hypothetical protein